MHLLQAGVDMTVIALWLGHESAATTYMYIEADLAMKKRALDKLVAPAPASDGAFLPTRSWPSWTAFDYAEAVSASTSRSPGATVADARGHRIIETSA